MKRVTSTARLTAASIFVVGATLTGAFAASDFEGPTFKRGGQGPGILSRFVEMDKDNDNKLSLEEFQIHAATRFDRADIDSDGVLTAEEIGKSMTARIKDKLRFVPGRAEKRIEHASQRVFERFDLNNDGKVTKMEQANHLSKRFALADRNDDEFVDVAEIEEAVHLIMGPRPHLSRDRARRKAGFFKPKRGPRPE